MDEIVTPGNMQQPDPNRPRLKKVKRPIRRIMPQGVGTPMPAAPYQPAGSGNPFTQQPMSAPQPEKTTENTATGPVNLDAYLDGPDNLPTPRRFHEEIRPQNPTFLNEEELAAENGVNTEEPPLPAFLTRKMLIGMAILLFATGFLMSKIFFSEEKIVRNGLQGVVINPEVPRGRARCGVAEKTQGCVLYIMNPQRQELNARDFYDLASQLTGRQRFVIETGNMRYSNVKIRPGDIGQFNIPPL